MNKQNTYYEVSNKEELLDKIKKRKTYFFYYMIALDVIANISIITDVSYGENSKIAFDFSSFIIILIFILIAKKIYDQLVSNKLG